MNFAITIAVLLSLTACTKKDGSDTKDKTDAVGADTAGTTDAATDAGTTDGTDAAVDDSGEDDKAEDTDASADADEGDDGNDLTNIITITGNIALSSVDANINDADMIDGLGLGLPIEGATVFVAGFADQSTTTDNLGNFTLALDTGVSAGLLAASYDVVTWKETSASPSVKFGKMTNGTPTGQTLDIGSVQLLHTKQARFTVKDGATDITATANCAIAFLDFGARVTPEFDVGFGKILADYLPEGDYRITTTCDLYQSKTETIHMPAPGGSSGWEGFDVTVVPI